MQEILETLILDFHSRCRKGYLPQPIIRQTCLLGSEGKIDAVIGVRRSGKTWYLFQTMHTMHQDGVSWENILYINFEDERLIPIEAKDLHLIEKTFYELYPDKTDEKCFFFFDEIQNVQGWDLYVRRLLDSGRVQLFITGSSAKLLSTEISTSLRGRYLSTVIFPLSFHEFLRFRGQNPLSSHRVNSDIRAAMVNFFKQYLLVGGFPEVQNVSDFDRIKILQEYMQSIMYRDIVERHNIKNLVALRRLISHLINNYAQLFSVNKFYNHLRSQQIKVDKNQLYFMTECLQDAFFMFLVSIHTDSEKARQVNPHKLYLIDPGMVIAGLKKSSPDWGSLLENVVFLELKRQGWRIEYYRTRKGLEVDFLVTDPISRQSALVQVSLNMKDKTTQAREFNAAEAAMTETGIKTCYVITGRESGVTHLENGKLVIIPAWQLAIDARTILFPGTGIEDQRIPLPHF